MKILFVIHLGNSKSAEDIRLMRILKAISLPNNKVGIVNNKDINLKYKNIYFYYELSKIEEKDWDIFLVHNTNNLISIAKVVKKKPILFVSNGISKHEQCLNFSNLYQIVATEEEIDPCLWGIPEEFVKHVCIPIYKPYKLSEKQSCDENQPGKVVYFINANDKNLKTSREVIKILNTIPYASVTVVTSFENISLLKDYANYNITFANQTKSLVKFFNEHDVVLASGEIALSAITSNKPVVVVGENGLGGVVCSENLEDFIRTRFTGRIGGSFNEIIPASLLDYEIQYALRIEDWVNRQLIDQAKIDRLKKIYTNKWNTLFINIIRNNVELYQMLSNKRMFIKMKPKTSKSVFIARGNNKFSIINAVTNKVIGLIGAEEFLVVENCNGERTVGDIIDSNPKLSIKETNDFLLQLWKNKIIVFLPR